MKEPRISLREHLLRFLRVGPISGKLFLLLVALDTLFYWFLEWLQPRDQAPCHILFKALEMIEVEKAWDVPAWVPDQSERSREKEGFQ